MDINQIEDRIAKKEAQIEKIKKRIKKWQDAKTVEKFKKEKEWLFCRDGQWVNYPQMRENEKKDDYRMIFNLSFEDFMKTAPERYEDYLKDCDSEIRRAVYDLEEAETTLMKYQNQLNAAKVKADKLSQEKIKVIWDFLEAYEQKLVRWYHRNLEALKEYHELNSQYCDYSNNRHKYMEEEGLTLEQYREKLREMNKMQRDAKSMVDPLTFQLYTLNRETGEYGLDEVKLKEILDKEIDNMYLRMIEQITEKIGEITDASYLSIGAKGDINGIIIGTNGKAKIQTIGAGGYNVGQIVNTKMGQRFHFRTLIHKLKEK